PAHAVLREAVEHLRRYLERSGDLGYAMAVLSTLRTSGGGAARQRAAYTRRSRPADVVDYLAEATVQGLEASITPPTAVPPAHARPCGG
ncbi:hypothetical protein ACFQZU_20915, partial [Streptomonospora algeriensis]